MRYLRVHWNHNHPDEPVAMYSELDDQSWELRKVEFFPDGRIGHAVVSGFEVASDALLEGWIGIDFNDDVVPAVGLAEIEGRVDSLTLV